MLIWKLIKGLIKVAISVGVIIFLIIWAIGASISYKQSSELPYDNVSYMIQAHEKNAEFPKGTWCECPKCHKNFYKENTPCCSHKCEREYQELVRAWYSAQQDKQFIENHGKKFK